MTKSVKSAVELAKCQTLDDWVALFLTFMVLVVVPCLAIARSLGVELPTWHIGLFG